MTKKLSKQEKILIALYNTDLNIWLQLTKLAEKGVKLDAQAAKTRQQGRKLIRRVQKSKRYWEILEQLNMNQRRRQ